MVVHRSPLEGEAKGRTEGRTEERAQLVLRVLENRGIPTSPETRDRVTDCTNPDTLGRWLDRAFTVSHSDSLFDEESWSSVRQRSRQPAGA